MKKLTPALVLLGLFASLAFFAQPVASLELPEGTSVLSMEEMAQVTGAFCRKCKTRKTCTGKFGIPCTLLSLCSICNVAVTEKTCGFSFNPFSSCTTLAAVGCGTEIIGACVPLTGVCTSTGIPMAVNGCGTAGNCV